MLSLWRLVATAYLKSDGRTRMCELLNILCHVHCELGQLLLKFKYMEEAGTAIANKSLDLQHRANVTRRTEFHANLI